MSRLSSQPSIYSRSSSVGNGVKRSGNGVMAAGYVKCRVCNLPTKREKLDALLRCERCEENRCRRCRGPLANDGECVRCIEVQVATDEETEARRERDLVDDCGNPARPGILTEDDEYNAYSGGVYEFNVNDDTIATIRDEDSLNEWRREMRGQYVTQGGLCPICFIEMSEVEARRGAHDDCLEALDG